MKLRTTLMIVLMLFHTTTVWAASVPVFQCPEEMQSMSANAHAMHQGMQSESDGPMQHDCCDGEMNDVACQLHCASAATVITQTPVLFKASEPVALLAEAGLTHRLPPHNLSLLRPPTSLS